MHVNYLEEKLIKGLLFTDKFCESLYSYFRKQLGYLINTRDLTAFITLERRTKILSILNTNENSKRKSQTIRVW